MVDSESFTLSCVIPTIGRDTLIEAVNSIKSENNPVTIIVIMSSTFENINLHNWLLSSGVSVHKSFLTKVSDLRNEGLSMVTSNWVSFLDDDDTWHTGFTDLFLEWI